MISLKANKELIVISVLTNIVVNNSKSLKELINLSI